MTRNQKIDAWVHGGVAVYLFTFVFQLDLAFDHVPWWGWVLGMTSMFIAIGQASQFIAALKDPPPPPVDAEKLIAAPPPSRGRRRCSRR